MYSTSANETSKEFYETYAINNSDIVVFTKDNFEEKISSKIYKISKNKLVKIR